MSNSPLVLKSYHIDYYFSLKAFDILYIALIIKSKKRLFLKKKAICLPIIKDILEKIIENKRIDFDKLNIDTKLKVV